MSAEEFMEWMAWFRQSFVGTTKANWAQAALAREVNRTLPRKKGDKVPPLRDFLWRAPDPLFVQRMEEEARATQQPLDDEAGE